MFPNCLSVVEKQSSYRKPTAIWLHSWYLILPQPVADLGGGGGGGGKGGANAPPFGG